MKKVSKIAITLIFLLILGICLNINTSQADSILELNNLQFEATIKSDGSMDVTEIWDIDIIDTNTLYKTFKIDKSRYTGLTDVTVTDISNGGLKTFEETKEWKYHLTKGTYFAGINNDGLYEISWGVGLDSSSGHRKYEINYTVQDAIAKYNDYAELYWQFVGADFEISCNKIQGRIILPQSAESKSDIKVWGHTEDLNGEIYVTSNNEISFEINNFRAGRYVEVRTLFPTEMIAYSGRQKYTEIFNSVIEEETIWAEEANARRQRAENAKKMAVGIIDVAGIALFIYQIFSIKKKSQKIKETVKIVPTEEMEYYRDIPRENATPTEAIYLLKSIFNLDGSQLGNDFSAILLDLKLKNIIDFEIEKEAHKKDNVTIKILKDFPDNMQDAQDEKAVFDFIKNATKNSQGSDMEITMKELEKYIKNHSSKVIKLKDKIEETAKKSLEGKKLVDKERKSEYEKSNTYKIVYITFLMVLAIFAIPMVFELSKWILIGTLPLIIAMIINLVMLSKLSKKLGMYTQEGIDEQVRWKALKKYMEDFSLLKEREVPEIALWEKFLVYATGFGIAKKVLKQLKMVYPNLEEQLDINTYSTMYLMMHTDFSSTFSDSISNSMASAYSSSTGGGGGFSGGGGGGRWPEVVEEVDSYLLPQKKK